MNQSIKVITANFIEIIWNRQRFSHLDQYMHSSYQDHSLPPAFSPDKEGLQQWIKNTSASFLHQTTIEEMVSEENKVMLKISLQLQHRGLWRGIAPTGATIQVVGYRFFQFEGSVIIGHWALIDGNAIEQQLKAGGQGCAKQQ